MKDLGWLSDFVGKANWIILIFLGIFAFTLTKMDVFLGVIAGGLIAGTNFHLLNRTIQKMLHSGYVAQGRRSIVWGGILARYYIRFFASATLIFICISNQWVHPLGLLAGISVVVLSIFLGTIVLVADSLFKEAV